MRSSNYQRGYEAEREKRKRYERYIEEISGNYAEAAGDDGWGGFGAREMARRLHPYEKFN